MFISMLFCNQNAATMYHTSFFIYIDNAIPKRITPVNAVIWFTFDIFLSFNALSNAKIITNILIIPNILFIYTPLFIYQNFLTIISVKQRSDMIKYILLNNIFSNIDDNNIIKKATNGLIFHKSYTTITTYTSSRCY